MDRDRSDGRLRCEHTSRIRNESVGETSAIARRRIAAATDPIALVLRDTRAVMLRPALPGDLDLMSKDGGRFSDETLYRRFMSSRCPGGSLLRSLFDVDFVDHFAQGDEIAGPFAHLDLFAIA